tara:strand:+ start:543 stop:971 length:429 start_codon:yes stop_codon:yes gene_type:complete
MTATSDINPIWARFVALQMEEWVQWLRNIHIRSYFDMIERFIHLNPYYYPDNTISDSEMGQLFDRMVINKEFMEQISDRGLLVWANSGFPDFVIALKPYGKVYPEIALVTSFFESNLVWFRRIYQFLRAELVMQLRDEGRKI